MVPTQRITIKDIAKECGVSLSTVSLVLNNNPRISEKTRLSISNVGYLLHHALKDLAVSLKRAGVTS